MAKRKFLSETHPHLIEEWDHEKNGDLLPGTVSHGSHKRVWWRHTDSDPCGGHSWVAPVYNRTNKKHPRGCPACSGRVCTRENNLEVKFYGVSKEWHPTKNKGLIPKNVAPGAGKLVWWQHTKNHPCGGHSWKAAIYDRTKKVKPTGCPACFGRVSTPINNLLVKSPKLVEEWDTHKNGDLHPEDVTCGSGKKVWWLHTEEHPCGGHSWQSDIKNRARKKDPVGCPLCFGGPVSRSSQRWLDFLKISKREFYIKELNFRVDGYNPKTNTVYEFLGDYWHGNPKRFKSEDFNKHSKKSFGTLFKETQDRFNKLEKAGYKVIYIWEKDFLS